MKNKEVLMDAIGDVDEKLIPEPIQTKSRMRLIRRNVIAGVCAATIIFAVAVPILVHNRSNVAPLEPVPSQAQNETQPAPTVIENKKENESELLLSEAEYPKALAHPKDHDYDAYDEWNNERNTKIQKANNYRVSFDRFVKSSTGTILKSDEKKNTIYSPMSLFMALGMSAEVTGGDTRQQILDTLKQEDADTLRTEVKNLWESCYNNDGQSKCVLANSMWTNNKWNYRQETLHTLSSSYYASAYTGDPLEDSYSFELQRWLNKQTDGLLEKYTSNVEFDPMMVLTLASTVNFSGTWDEPMSDFGEDLFHAATEDITCNYLSTVKSTEYYWGDKFSAVALRMNNSGEMRLILPDEGCDPQELIQNEEALQYITHYKTNDYENHQSSLMSIKVPRFDVNNQIDLKDKMKELGIIDVFDSSTADYSPLCDSQGIYLDKIEQANRVMIDENGCKAVSITIAGSSGSSSEKKEMRDFILDRPFMFELVSDSGIPLFVGIVYDPR